ncbi:hypothetical protein H5T87_07550 [bacterium]|nr:hypothetical protein [bacterium]
MNWGVLSFNWSPDGKYIGALLVAFEDKARIAIADVGKTKARIIDSVPWFAPLIPPYFLTPEELIYFKKELVPATSPAHTKSKVPPKFNVPQPQGPPGPLPKPPGPLPKIIQRLVLFNIHTGKKSILWETSSGQTTYEYILAFKPSPNGKYIALVLRESETTIKIQILKISQNKCKMLEELHGGESRYAYIDWHPSGNELVVATDRHLYLFSVEGKKAELL